MGLKWRGVAIYAAHPVRARPVFFFPFPSVSSFFEKKDLKTVSSFLEHFKHAKVQKTKLGQPERGSAVKISPLCAGLKTPRSFDQSGLFPPPAPSAHWHSQPPSQKGIPQ